MLRWVIVGQTYAGPNFFPHQIRASRKRRVVQLFHEQIPDTGKMQNLSNFLVGSN